MKRGSNSPKLRGVPEMAVTAADDLLAYEKLPAVIRTIIREASVELAATSILKLWEDMDVGPLAHSDRLRWLVDGLLGVVRNMAAAERAELTRELEAWKARLAHRSMPLAA